MTHRLCRTLLVNAGTNQRIPSSRITAVDPRGGAAVLGDNGVGKTSTLQIVPLFFGHSPSQIVSAGQGMEPMIRFLLPTDASAIVFEYQRGLKDSDIRLAVIRRRPDDPDTPFYRLYNCGFRKDLFVRDGRFLADEETQLQATSFGISTTGKLSTAEHRSVILAVPSNTKERERLRRFSLEFSYGPRSLDNLDRLVAAMVKKHVKFTDIVQVAVGLVQQDIGQGSDRSRLVFRQGKAPIERWLRNRASVAAAFKLEGEVLDLGSDLKEYRAAESRFRSRRADVDALKEARTHERTAVAGAIDLLEKDRQSALEREEVERTELAEASRVANQEAIRSKHFYDASESQESFFERERAGYWESQIEGLPTLRLNRQSLVRQLDAAEAAHADATSRYEGMRQDLRNRAADRRLGIETSKQPHHRRLTQALAQIGDSEKEASTQATALRDGQRDSLDADKAPLLEQRGAWGGRKGEPAASREALDALSEANAKRHRHTGNRSSIVDSVARAKSKDEAAKRDGLQLDAAIRAAQTRLQELIEAAAEARGRMNPQPGSFLAKLRGHSDDDWRRDLAKVIDPRLLEREDLDPVHAEESARTLYGWGLRTSVISTPDWVDNESAKRIADDADSRVGAAKAHLEALQARVSTVVRAQKEAEQAVQVAEATLATHDANTPEVDAAFERATHRVNTERNAATATAEAEMNRLSATIQAIEEQVRSLKATYAVQLEQIRLSHAAQRLEAQATHDVAIAKIDESLKTLDDEVKRQEAAIDAQLAEHLSAQGVDPQRLLELREKVKAINRQTDELESKESLVERWRTWQAEGGSARVKQLLAVAERAQEAAREATGKLTSFDVEAEKARSRYETAKQDKSIRRDAIDDDLQVLTGLEDEFGSYQAVGASVIDPSTTVKELRGKVHAERQKIDNLERTITSTTGKLMVKLTTEDSAVRDLIEASMAGASEGPIGRAQELCSAYRLIGPQVATDVNRSLSVLLANIGAFHKSISNFEREVKAFNVRLQTGLSAVRFERIKDLRVDLVTNFDTLGFYKKLSRMDEVARQHASEYGKDLSRDLPSDEVTQAVGAFLSVLGGDGALEVNLASHITLRGSVTDNGVRKEFRRESEFESISSTGLTTLVKVTLMTGLLNTIRGSDQVYVPWVTDEVGTIDPGNFVALMQMLKDNWIDVMTASPELGPTQHALFARRYLFEDKGRIREYVPAGGLPQTHVPASPEVEVQA
ncbi:ATP-binding protein [Variovorax paradoxus]|nr:ATP-binding protein [Variovorax paradoxus]